ncbi:GNAT family N-acetyltransferase [Phenylobacterium sp.]|uniref:GNAT family N-acetyltransferase n=1 Tax=Phenylobacterium sp. TaxID=1871053 RepID=UPI0025FBF168|nr:GNAT family N-acetyltransferase [Phenylobacterium sp.]MBX3483356.1 GNAT family N-acetyltransferase [Phenylobacterium sp.]
MGEHHDLSRFNCGVASLDQWLIRRARSNQVAGASRTYILADGAEVLGYYALASGAVAIGAAPGRFRRNMPEPVPVVLLGRLAISRDHQRKGLGNDLFTDAVRRVLQASELIGIRGLVAHAESEEVVAFYRAMGLEPSPLSPLNLMATLSDLRSGFG